MSAHSSVAAQPSLRRALGLTSAVSIVIGTVIGSGVFLVPSSMIRNVGSVPVMFGVWILAGLLSLFGALLEGAALSTSATAAATPTIGAAATARI